MPALRLGMAPAPGDIVRETAYPRSRQSCLTHDSVPAAELLPGDRRNTHAGTRRKRHARAALGHGTRPPAIGETRTPVRDGNDMPALRLGMAPDTWRSVTTRHACRGGGYVRPSDTSDDIGRLPHCSFALYATDDRRSGRTGFARTVAFGGSMVNSVSSASPTNATTPGEPETAVAGYRLCGCPGVAGFRGPG